MRLVPLALALFFALAICSRAQAVEPERYVVIVPSVDWDVEGAGEWYARFYVEWLTAAGYRPVVADVSGTITESAPMVKATVDALPVGSQVHIIGFQKGGLTARYYMRFYGGANRISTYVSLDTSQYGQVESCLFFAENCMWSPVITALNSGDDTPGTARYVQVRARTDQRLLDGGLAAFIDTPWTTHLTIQDDRAVFELVLLELR